MFLALALLICCAAQETTEDTFDIHGKRTGTIRETAPPPDRFDVYDTHGNRKGYGQRSPINGDIDLYDTHGRRQNTVVKPSGGGRGSRGR